MRKRLITITLMLTSLALVAGTASAELLAGVQAGYGSTNYGKILGLNGLKGTEWLANIWVDYQHEDLLFNGSYQGALGLRDTDIGRHLAQVGANYRFFEDGPLQVYGGLGYHLISTRFEVPGYVDGDKFTLTGHGFSGQAVVDIEISPEFRTSATLALTPWVNWSFSHKGVTDSNIDSHSSFTAKLDLFYDFSEEFGLHLGISGGNYKVPEFSTKDGKQGETQATYSAINLGITRSF